MLLDDLFDLALAPLDDLVLLSQVAPTRVQAQLQLFHPPDQLLLLHLQRLLGQGGSHQTLLHLAEVGFLVGQSRLQSQLGVLDIGAFLGEKKSKETQIIIQFSTSQCIISAVHSFLN